MWRWMHLLCVATFNCWSNKIHWQESFTSWQWLSLFIYVQCHAHNSETWVCTSWPGSSILCAFLHWQCVSACQKKAKCVWPADPLSSRRFVTFLRSSMKLLIALFTSQKQSQTALQLSTDQNVNQTCSSNQSQLLSNETQTLAHKTLSRPGHYLHTPQNPGLWQKWWQKTDRQKILAECMAQCVRKGSEGRDATENQKICTMNRIQLT